MKKKFIKKENIIKFIASNEAQGSTYDPPVPAASMIAEWYKKQPTSYDEKIVINPAGNTNRTIKACMPIFDVMTAGYFVMLPADVLVNQDEFGNPMTSWSSDLYTIIDSHDRSQYQEFSVPEGYYEAALKFNNPWTIKTPPGYSCLFIQPSLRDDLPFYIVPGIVDTDKHPVSINFPFFIKKGFTGVLEFNTPIVQVIPFKRENWNSEIEILKNDEPELAFQRAKRKIQNRYKTFYRSPKSWK
jgi:hypothetical protein